VQKKAVVEHDIDIPIGGAKKQVLKKIF